MNLILLKALLEAAAPSGSEERAAAVFLEEARTFADRTYTDHFGNVYAEIGPSEGRPRVLEAHIDEIGVMVSHVDQEGNVYFHEIGGMDKAIYVGARVRLLAPGGDLIGVVGRKPIHLMSGEEKVAGIKLEELSLDLALEPDEVKKRVPNGTVGVLEAPVLFVGQRVVSRALDNRIGVYAVLEALRQLKNRGCTERIVLVGSVQEEVGHYGAKMAAYGLDPLEALVVDVTFETSQSGVDVKRLGESPFGSGVNLCVMPILHSGLRKKLERTATAHNLPFTVTSGSSVQKSFSNADDFTLSRRGVPTALLSIPCRSMHSPGEQVDLRDVEVCIRLMVEYVLESAGASTTTILDELKPHSVGSVDGP